jgi:hypothetical protein
VIAAREHHLEDRPPCPTASSGASPHSPSSPRPASRRPGLRRQDARLLLRGSPEGFNPQFFTTGTTADASSVPIYNRLVEFELGTTNIVPGLAESWTAAPDGLSYTFKLSKGVKFHSNAKFTPTRDFNADDVLFSYNRQADPKHPYAKVTPGQTYAYFEDMGMNDIVEQVEKVDPMTVRFVLKKPEAPFMADMAMDFASILSAEYAEKMMAAKTPDVVDKEPIGTGPFQFVSYQKDAVIRYKAFDQHWDGRPKIDNLVYAITTDASVRYAKLKAGECHVMAFPKPADVALMKNDPNINLVQQQGLNVGYIAFNVEKKPFDSKLVRQALNMAVNKKAILDSVFQGAGQVAKNPIPPTLWGYNDRSRLSLRPGEGEGAAGAGRLSERHRGRALVPAGDAAVQPRRQAHGRADPGRLGEGRRQDQAHHLRVGRVQEAQQDRRAARDDVRLVGRQRRPRQLLRAAARLRRGQGRRQRRALVRQGLREPAADGQARDAPDRPGRLLRQGAGHRPRGGAVDHDRPLGALRPGSQGSRRLQDGRDRAPLLPQGGHHRPVMQRVRARAA